VGDPDLALAASADVMARCTDDVARRVDPAARPTRIKLVLFALIGVCNTLFDVAFYTFLRSVGQSAIVANVISASVALVGSYLLNSKLTFRSKQWTARHFAAFVAVTLFGLWVLQTSAIYGINHILTLIPERYWSHLGSVESTMKLALPKLLATVVTFVWNYCWYNKVIFSGATRLEQVSIALE
jgi:putative flippase GtrA